MTLLWVVFPYLGISEITTQPGIFHVALSSKALQPFRDNRNSLQYTPLMGTSSRALSLIELFRTPPPKSLCLPHTLNFIHLQALGVVHLVPTLCRPKSRGGMGKTHAYVRTHSLEALCKKGLARLVSPLSSKNTHQDSCIMYIIILYNCIN